MRRIENSVVLLVATLPVAAALLVLQWSLRPERVGGFEPEPLGFTIDLNAADRSTLQLLPGVGAGLADAIVEHRERVGGFDSVEQLEDVPRIGTMTRERVEPWVTVGAPAR